MSGYTPDFLYWIIFFGILTLGMRWYAKWSNNKSPKKDLLSNEEIATREKEKFPIWYHLFYPIYIVVMIGFAVGLVFLSWFFVTHYPEWMLAGKEYIALSTNPYAMYLLLTVFFPGIILGGLLLSPIDRIFPEGQMVTVTIN